MYTFSGWTSRIKSSSVNYGKLFHPGPKSTSFIILKFTSISFTIWRINNPFTIHLCIIPFTATIGSEFEKRTHISINITRLVFGRSSVVFFLFQCLAPLLSVFDRICKNKSFKIKKCFVRNFYGVKNRISSIYQKQLKSPNLHKTCE